MFKLNVAAYSLSICILACFSTANSSAQIEEKKLDNLIEATLKTFDVPGISVGIFLILLFYRKDF